ncbi:MAG: response regulator transcription factor [Tissierellia bacterium]|nr:response regulator transcription factor [Tissierellia bacterium]
MAKILIVEDDKRIGKIIKDYLKKNNHEIVMIEDGMDVMSEFISYRPDLILLDLMLPNLDGYKICELIRSISDVPIIMITAKGEEIDKLKGYECGADDYVTKPFSPKVLVAKVHAILKRGRNNDPLNFLQYGIINLDILKREVFVGEKEILLTYKEFELLKLFMENPGIVFSRNLLLERVWGYDFEGGTRTVDTHIKTLRKKLGEGGSYIITMIRSGYKFEDR